tara:strand:- start:3468 stop:4658 length:1191 start_codon:yes stop_codon:yes gene_type:complete
MSFLYLPKIYNSNIEIKLKIKKDKNNIPNCDNIYISKSLNHCLNDIKKNIKHYIDEWDTFKKYTNTYEYIHTSVGNKKLPICKYKPLSRSFFKMIEIIHVFDLLTEKNPINSMHLAEGPGGFIEAFSNIRDNYEDNYYGITLISNDINVPSWKSSQNYLLNNKNIQIEYGKDNDGNLFSYNNFLSILSKHGNSMNYITADGGFDFSIDFNKQEEISTKLIVTQILYAIVLQKPKGTFVVKIFDTFTKIILESIYLLSCLYKSIYVYKPNTSRLANSEKYLICKEYTENNNVRNYIIKNFSNIIDNINELDSLINVSIPKYYILKFEEINITYGYQQIENIKNTINLINEKNSSKNLENINSKINILISNNIMKSINWCNKHNLPINKIYLENNYKL